MAEKDHEAYSEPVLGRPNASTNELFLCSIALLGIVHQGVIARSMSIVLLEAYGFDRVI